MAMPARLGFLIERGTSCRFRDPDCKAIWAIRTRIAKQSGIWGQQDPDSVATHTPSVAMHAERLTRRS
jgi:hypothetical protein